MNELLPQTLDALAAEVASVNDAYSALGDTLSTWRLLQALASKEERNK